MSKTFISNLTFTRLLDVYFFVAFMKLNLVNYSASIHFPILKIPDNAAFLKLFNNDGLNYTPYFAKENSFVVNI
jgi:hypothetical protein